MKIILSLLIVSSCATYIAKGPEDVCASQGMKLAGTNSSSGFINGPGRNNQYVTNNYGVQCVVPETTYEKCLADNHQYALGPVDNYNADSGAKYKINSLAYMAFVIPGIGMKLYYDNQRDSVIEEAKKRFVEKRGTCEGFRSTAGK